MSESDEMDEREPHFIIRNRTAYQLFMLHSLKPEVDEELIDVDENNENKKN